MLRKLDQLINAFIKDSYLAIRSGELYLVINSLKHIIELRPKLAKEWDSYIVKLELLLENQKQNFTSREEY